ncbi:MAG: hypothetical protein ABIR11_03570 [Candidatus Limnocylindrales bacterium]
MHRPLYGLLAILIALAALPVGLGALAAPAEPVTGACRVRVQDNGSERWIVKPDAFCVPSVRDTAPTAPPTATRTATPTATPPITPAAPSATVAPTATVPAPSGVWRITVYYTAVEAYHTDAPVAVTGCPTLAGGNCGRALGSWPQSFVRAVKAEGTGRLNDGRYLNWSVDTGYWLDTLPRASYGNVLVPYQSSAADGVQRGTAFRVLTCGTDAGNGDPVDPAFCRALKDADWIMDDEFTPGLGGQRHVDLYIGEEDSPNFVKQSPKVIDTTGGTTTLP